MDVYFELELAQVLMYVCMCVCSICYQTYLKLYIHKWSSVLFIMCFIYVLFVYVLKHVLPVSSSIII